MSNPSHFIQDLLRKLQSRAEAAAKRHPGLRHMLVLPPGESIRIPPPIGNRPVGFSSPLKRLSTRKFGQTGLVGPLPPRNTWPKGVEPLRAIVAERDFIPYHPNAQEPFRSHLFFGGSDRAFGALQLLANDLSRIRRDVSRALGHCSLVGDGVFYTGNSLHGAAASRLDSWLCTVHWWAWSWRESPFRKMPQVLVAGHTYDVDPHDDALKAKLAFSSFDADILTASASTLSMILGLFAKPPVQDDEKEKSDADKEPKVREVSVKQAIAEADDWNALTDRQRTCIRTLLELRAFDADSRKSADYIAVKAEGRNAKLNGFKEPLSDLVSRGFTKSKIGRRGGYWLTDTGRELTPKEAGQPPS